MDLIPGSKGHYAILDLSVSTTIFVDGRLGRADNVKLCHRSSLTYDRASSAGRWTGCRILQLSGSDDGVFLPQLIGDLKCSIEGNPSFLQPLFQSRALHAVVLHLTAALHEALEPDYTRTFSTV